MVNGFKVILDIRIENITDMAVQVKGWLKNREWGMKDEG
jgi:hypothetical protein